MKKIMLKFKITWTLVLLCIVTIFVNSGEVLAHETGEIHLEPQGYQILKVILLTIFIVSSAGTVSALWYIRRSKK